MSEYDVDIVIVTHNSAPVIEGLLDSITKEAGGSLRFHTVVVDNGSSDGTVAMLRDRDDCRIIAADNKGYSAGINLGVRESTGAHAVLVLNADTRLRAGSIEALIQRLRRPRESRRPESDIVVPRVVNTDGSLFHSLRREPTIRRSIGLNFTRLRMFSEYVNDDRDYAKGHVVDWALGAAMMFTRELYETLGGWDESYFLYSEETDFCLRAADIGFTTLYVPGATVEHIGGASGRNDLTHTMQALNRVRLYRRRHGAVLSSVYYLVNIASESSWVVRGHSQSVPAVRALLRRSHRPAVLALPERRIPA